MKKTVEFLYITVFTICLMLVAQNANAEKVWIEAESGTLNYPMQTSSDGDASGGSYIQVLDGSGSVWSPPGETSSGVAACTFNVAEGGSYVIWGRNRANNGNNDSFYICVDGGTDHLWDVYISSGWTWDKVNNRNHSDPSIFNISAGEHTLYVKRREDGTPIDKILITNEMDYVPEGKGGSQNREGTMSFQATFGDDQGNPLTGMYDVTFRIYDAPAGGDLMWEETQSIDVSDGLLDAELGSVTPFNIAFDKQYWLGVEIGSDGEMTPRFKLTSAPYAFRVEE
jgi:hypothetical protein